MNRKPQGVLQECKQHETDVKSSGSSILRSSGYWWTVGQVWHRIRMWKGEWWCESVRHGAIQSGKYLGGVSQPCGLS